MNPLRVAFSASKLKPVLTQRPIFPVLAVYCLTATVIHPQTATLIHRTFEIFAFTRAFIPGAFHIPPHQIAHRHTNEKNHNDCLQNRSFPNGLMVKAFSDFTRYRTNPRESFTTAIFFSHSSRSVKGDLTNCVIPFSIHKKIGSLRRRNVQERMM